MLAVCLLSFLLTAAPPAFAEPCPASASSEPGDPNCTWLVNNGEPERRFNIIFLGDGFTASEQDIFNQKVDVDSAVLKGLADLRLQGEKEIVRLDQATLQGRLRIFLAALVLTPAILLYFVVFLRK